MEVFFLVTLMVLMALALGSGFPVAFALPGASIATILLAGAAGLIATGDAGAYFFTGTPWQWLSAGVTNLRSVYWVPQRDTLIAVPLFIFMGIMLQKSRIAEDLLVTMAQLFGPVPGGLGISVVFVGALLAATTGIVGATVVAMGLISLPAMLRNNYSHSLATGTIAASGTLGQIIPPSIVLIILADQLSSATDQAGNLRTIMYKQATGELSMPSIFEVTSTSAGEMFLGALAPGLVLVGLYMVYILGFALLRPKSAPAVHREGGFDAEFAKKVALALVPPLTLIFLVLGSIILGVATVNQAGAIGSAGAMVMAGYRLPESDRRRYWPALLALLSVVVLYFTLSNFEMNIKRINTTRDMIGIVIGIIASTTLILSLIWSGLRAIRIDNTMHSVMVETAKTTSLVFIILMGAAILTAGFRAFGGEELVRNFLETLPGGFWTKFWVVMGVIFILGFFIDFIEISVVVVPIVAPILLADPSANVTAVWLGVMIGLNMQTSFLTPPFGFALFYLRGVAPAIVKTVSMYRGVIPFIMLQLAALAIVALNPPLVNYLPNRVKFLSEVSPPPRNPKLQYCLEQYVEDKLQADNGVTRSAIDAALRIDLGNLPPAMANDLKASFKAAGDAIGRLDQAFVLEKQVEELSPAYRERLVYVRGLQKQIRTAQDRIKELKVFLSQSGRGDSEAEKARDRAEIKRLEAEIEQEKAKIPADWQKVYTAFQTVNGAEKKARLDYRRNADKAYSGPQKALDILNATPAFLALEGELKSLKTAIETGDPKETASRIRDIERKLTKVAGTSTIKSALSKARRVLKKRKPKISRALKQYDKAMKAYESQKIWRAEAEKTLRPGLETFLKAITPTLGIRSQEKLTREQALYLAWCGSDHKDISLNF